MRGLLTATAFLVGIAAVNAASAAPVLRNVAGFDPGLLAGKTCQGWFNTGRRREGSQGALQVSFAVNGDVLTAHLWRRLGKEAYDKAAYAVTQPGQSDDTTSLDDLGEVRRLRVPGKKVRYVDPTGGKVRLTYDQGRLRGQSDPRGGSEWKMTRVANVMMVCR
jgi:YD repeat-containing protein